TLLGKIWKTRVVTEALPPAQDDAPVELYARQIDERARKLFGRSLHIRQVDAGSCNGCELEISALNNPYYDLERFGLHFVASPRHADCLLVTGPVTRNMAEPLRRTYEATPAPKLVVAAGGYGVVGGVDAVVPVDCRIPGCPPSPRALLEGLLTLMARLRATPGRL